MGSWVRGAAVPAAVLGNIQLRNVLLIEVRTCVCCEHCVRLSVSSKQVVLLPSFPQATRHNMQLRIKYSAV